jgi:RIO kinase 1
MHRGLQTPTLTPKHGFTPSDDDSADQYAAYETRFDPLQHDRQARRARKPKVKHTPKRAQADLLQAMAETEGLEGGFITSYRPSLFEAGWLLDSLRPFYEQAQISDVLALVRGGKEANVYRCQSHQSVNTPLLAAKVYRPRMFRQLRNDKMYREGREIVGDNGRPVKPTDTRVVRALNKKSAFGEQVAHTSWLMHEFKALQVLHNAGAFVPKPYANAENALLMTYCGDEHLAAPALSQISLDLDEARQAFNQVMHTFEIMLTHGMIHGDLSAYNILYWQGQITVIDFPQVTYYASNPHAKSILQRDVVRVCEYFSEQGIERDAGRIARRLWGQYANTSHDNQLADFSEHMQEEAADLDDEAGGRR